MEIRAEGPADIGAIRAVTEAAFASAPYASGTEAVIIEALRNAGALTVSLVAVEEGSVIGHVAFSPVTIDGEAGDWQGLGPLSVLPAHQRQGVGQALVREGLRLLAACQAVGCVVLGDPAYYRRFGFKSDPALYYGDVPAGYLQRLCLSGAPPGGEVKFHRAFEVEGSE